MKHQLKEPLQSRIYIALALAWLSFAPLNAQETEPEPKTVPLFTLMDHNGNEVSLESYRGSIVMINFWATWCAPCIEEMPTMQALKTHFTGRPFQILAVNMGENESEIKAFIERINIDFTFPLLVDPTTSVADAYKVSGLPATLLVDKEGVFVFGGVGSRDWNSKESQELILALLDL